MRCSMNGSQERKPRENSPAETSRHRSRYRFPAEVVHSGLLAGCHTRRSAILRRAPCFQGPVGARAQAEAEQGWLGTNTLQC